MNSRKLTWILPIVLVCLLAGAAWAAGGHGEEASPWNTGKLIWRVINTIALIALLVYFLKKPLQTFFSERTAGIRRELAEAKELRMKAEETIKEYEAKIAGMERELDRMRGELQKAAGAESEKVIINAERMSASVVEAAKLAAEQEVRKAKAELQGEAVKLAVQLAESLIREKINQDDHKRIVEDYLAKVEGMK